MAKPDPFNVLAQGDPAAAAKIMQRIAKRLMVPHDGGQQEVLESDARFRILRAGRRWGKTKLAAREVVSNAIAGEDRMVWWVANTYRNVRRGYREVLRQLPPEFLAKPAPPATANELVLQLKNGTMIEFYSGGNPDALAGEGVDFVVIDEAALIPEHVWTQLIRPTLMDSKGKALIISTPRGHNWFWQLWQRGQDPMYKNYASWHFTSYDNPYIDNEEVEEAKASSPHIIFQQEFLAEFISHAASIFDLSGDDVRIVPNLAAPVGHIYMGVDLAKKEDFTVISASREGDRLPVYHDRFNSLSWPTQRALIIDAVRDIEAMPGVDGVTVMIDATGGGDVMVDDLEDEGLDVIGIKFSNAWKTSAVKLLAAALETGEAAILEHQVTEFEHYEYHLTPSGNYTFEAPAGGHDDEVAAKMLEHWGHVHEGPGNVTLVNTDGHVVYDDQAAEEAVTPGDIIYERVGSARSSAELMADPAVWSSAGF